MRKTVLVVCLIFSSLHGFCQPEKIETDRPSETLTPHVALNKWFQVETGVLKQVEKLDEGRTRIKIFTHPTIILKYGIVKNLELRMISEYQTEKFISPFQYITDRGVSELQAGVKYNFIKGQGIRPFVSIIAHYSFRRLINVDSIDGANFRFALANNISENLSIAYNVGMQWRRFASPHVYIYTLSPRIIFSENWKAFVEVYGTIYNDTSPEHFANIGLSHFMSDNLSVDASAGIRLSKGRPHKFFGLGFSYRFKTRTE